MLQTKWVDAGNKLADDLMYGYVEWPIAGHFDRMPVCHLYIPTPLTRIMKKDNIAIW